MYQYATIDADMFLQASKVPPQDSYLTKDPQVDALKDLLEKGYQFVMMDPASNLVLFEKEIPSENSEAPRSDHQQVIQELVAGLGTAIEHADGKGWRSPDVRWLLKTLMQKAKDYETQH